MNKWKDSVTIEDVTLINIILFWSISFCIYINEITALHCDFDFVFVFYSLVKNKTKSNEPEQSEGEQLVVNENY